MTARMKQGDIPSLVERAESFLREQIPSDAPFWAHTDDAQCERVQMFHWFAEFAALSQPKEDAVGGGVPTGMVARERIARIIDPNRWALVDHWGSLTDRPDLTPRVEDETEPSLAKADAILAALPTGDAALVREACATLVDSRVRHQHSFAYGNEVLNPEVAEIAAAIRAMRLPTALPTSDASERLQEAIRLARPIVESDLAQAIDTADADWEGMSRTALEAIDAALSNNEVSDAGA